MFDIETHNGALWLLQRRKIGKDESFCFGWVTKFQKRTFFGAQLGSSMMDNFSLGKINTEQSMETVERSRLGRNPTNDEFENMKYAPTYQIIDGSFGSKRGGRWNKIGEN